MTPDDRFDGTVSVWLQDRAGTGAPDYLDDILSRSARIRQRPGWTFLERWPPIDISAGRAVFPSRFPMRALALFVVLALVLAALVAFAIGSHPQRVPPPFGPFGPAANGLIAYVQGADIYVANADGSGLHAAVAGAGNDSAPWYSHDGTTFMFYRTASGEDGTSVMAADADGSHVRPIVQGLTNPVWFEWSPDDKQGLIVYDVLGIPELSIVDADGSGEPRQISPVSLGAIEGAHWLPPAGERIVFTARPSSATSFDSAIYSIKRDGTDLDQIMPTSPAEAAYSALQVSPDGRWLSYWQPEPDARTGQPSARIHLIELATGIDNRMTFDPASVDEFQLQFSPDGKTGVVTRQTQGSSTDQLTVVSIDGSEPARLLGAEFDWGYQHQRDVTYSPDGKQVVRAFAGQRPTFIDVGTGIETTGPRSLGEFSSWQRLAP